MSPSQRSSGTPALVQLQQAGIDFTLRRHEVDMSQRHGFGMGAARALGVSPERVFKTLMVQVPDDLVCAVIPANSSLDLRALSQSLGVKGATMAEVAVAEHATGYLVGGISPFGQRNTHTTVIDQSARQFNTVFVSAGARAAIIEISPTDLATQTAAIFASIARD